MKKLIFILLLITLSTILVIKSESNKVILEKDNSLTTDSNFAKSIKKLSIYKLTETLIQNNSSASKKEIPQTQEDILQNKFAEIDLYIKTHKIEELLNDAQLDIQTREKFFELINQRQKILIQIADYQIKESQLKLSGVTK